MSSQKDLTINLIKTLEDDVYVCFHVINSFSAFYQGLQKQINMEQLWLDTMKERHYTSIN